MINLEQKHLDIVKQILAQHVPECEVRMFGSRVNGTATTYSDVDLALVCDEEMDWRKVESLRDEFAESDLPMSVDVLDSNAVSDEFRAIILENYFVIQKPSSK